MSQPHSGTCRCADCQDIDSATDIGGAIREAVKVAEPTRTEAQLDSAIAAVKSYREVVARTEAEQAVLDAAAWGHEDMLRKVLKDYGYSAWVHMVATRELERRGLA